MNRTILILFSSLLITSSLLGIHGTSNSFQWFFATTPALDAIRFGLAIGLILIAMNPSIKDPAIHILLKGMGISFIGLFVLSIFTPTFWGLRQYYLLPFDLFLTVQCGIVCLLTVFDMEDAKEAEERNAFIVRNLFSKNYNNSAVHNFTRHTSHASGAYRRFHKQYIHNISKKAS